MRLRLGQRQQRLGIGHGGLRRVRRGQRGLRRRLRGRSGSLGDLHGLLCVEQAPAARLLRGVGDLPRLLLCRGRAAGGGLGPRRGGVRQGHLLGSRRLRRVQVGRRLGEGGLAGIVQGVLVGGPVLLPVQDLVREPRLPNRLDHRLGGDPRLLGRAGLGGEDQLALFGLAGVLGLPFRVRLQDGARQHPVVVDGVTAVASRPGLLQCLDLGTELQRVRLGSLGGEATEAQEGRDVVGGGPIPGVRTEQRAPRDVLVRARPGVVACVERVEDLLRLVQGCLAGTRGRIRPLVGHLLLGAEGEGDDVLAELGSPEVAAFQVIYRAVRLVAFVQLRLPGLEGAQGGDTRVTVAVGGLVPFAAEGVRPHELAQPGVRTGELRRRDRLQLGAAVVHGLPGLAAVLAGFHAQTDTQGALVGVGGVVPWFVRDCGGRGDEPADHGRRSGECGDRQAAAGSPSARSSSGPSSGF